MTTITNHGRPSPAPEPVLQRVHPVDVEAPPPSHPLIPRNHASSEKGDPETNLRRAPAPPPPRPRRTIPVAHTRPPRGRRQRSCCCKCVCWTVLTIILLAVAVAAAGGILYLVFDPKLPKYSVTRLSVTAFSVDTANLTAHAGFDVAVTAENPNKKIGIYYEDGSSLAVLYSASELCSGQFPAFYQGHQNVTVVAVKLVGSAPLGGGGGDVLTTLQQQEQQGAVPLEFRGDVPVRVKLGSLKLWRVTFRVDCDLTVNTIAVGSSVTVKSSNCRIKLKF